MNALLAKPSTGRETGVLDVVLSYEITVENADPVE